MTQSDVIRSTGKKRLEYLDIAKGIGILSVVWCHAKGPFSNYMYQFNMPLFFLISGYLFSSRNTPEAYVKNKIKSLYLPFVFWNVIFCILEAELHMVNFGPGGLLRRIVKVFLTLEKSGKFLGATWFLGALFVVSVSYKLLDYYLPDQKKKSIVLTCLFACLAATGFAVKLPYMQSRTLILSFFFAAGRMFREYRDDFIGYNKTILAVFSFCLFCLIGHYNSANMGANEYRYPLLFVIGAFLASYVVFYISSFLEKHSVYIKKILILMGKNSMPIVLWQFVVFRLVILVQLLVNGISPGQLLDYYPVYDASKGWWILYLIVGIVASMLLGQGMTAIKRCLKGEKQSLRER